MRNTVDIKLLNKQRSYLNRRWNELQGEPVKNKKEIQLIDGVLNLLDRINDELLDNGACSLVIDLP